MFFLPVKPATRTEFIPILISCFSLVVLFFTNFVTLPHLAKRPEFLYAERFRNEPKMELVSYQWNARRLHYVIPEREIPYGISPEHLEALLKERSQGYLIIERHKFDTLPDPLKEKLELVDRRPSWRKAKLNNLLKRLWAKDYGFFRTELMLFKYPNLNKNSGSKAENLF